MFKKIEKEFKKGTSFFPFNCYYWSCTILTYSLSYLFTTIFNVSILACFAIIFAILLFAYFIIDFINTTCDINDKVTNKFKTYISILISHININDINIFIKVLKNNNFKTKDDLKFAIQYYENKQPKNIKDNYLMWIVPIIISLSSFISIAYNTETKTIDNQIIGMILGTSIGYSIIFITGAIIIYSLINSIVTTRQKLKKQLYGYLLYLYINFDEFEKTK